MTLIDFNKIQIFSTSPVQEHHIPHAMSGKEYCSVPAQRCCVRYLQNVIQNRHRVNEFQMIARPDHDHTFP